MRIEGPGLGTRAAAFAAGLVAVALAAAALGGPAAAHEPDARTEAAGERLGSLIESRLRAGGPFFEAGERAAIERACGYPAGSWDGFEASMSDGVFHCTNGRRVDSAEVRAVMEAAGPRIGRRVEAVMESAEVTGAIEEVARTAEAEAMRGVEAAERAVEEAERALEDSRRARRR
jgi:hypothetical protein